MERGIGGGARPQVELKIVEQVFQLCYFKLFHLIILLIDFDRFCIDFPLYVLYVGLFYYSLF